MMNQIKMNLKSFDSQQVAIDQIKKHKSFEFVKLYKSASETNGEESTKKKVKKFNKNSQHELDSKPSKSANKNIEIKSNEILNLSNIEAVDHISSKTRSSRKSSLTSAPNNKSEYMDTGMKSIMKSKSDKLDSVLNISNASITSSKPKKRNKSVSFMLEDEEVVVKKSKSNYTNKEAKNEEKQQNNKEKVSNSKKRKQKKNQKAKENRNIKEEKKLDNKENVITETITKNTDNQSSTDLLMNEELPCGEKNKIKKSKKSTAECENVEVPRSVSEENTSENKSKRSKRKKRKAKSTQDENTNAEEEPAIKARKKDLKPEIIAKGLENLNIGDNPHTLTNLLDEMTVVDNNAKKKIRQKQKRNKQNNHLVPKAKTISHEKSPPQHNSIREEKEKVKWHSRKWNKDTKGTNKSSSETSIIVENLPLKIMCNYKTLLSEHFSRFGTIAGVGVAEAYPTEDIKAVFTTTIFFQEEEAVIKALEEDNTVLEGSRVRVRRPLPPTETTVVVRAYGLSDQALSSMFSAAGRVRAIRTPIKGKKSMPTAFVEFDGPEAVQRALKIAEDAKINGKNMYISKYDIRSKKKSNHKRQSENDCLNNDGNDSSTE